jgi:hypothetical protein
VTPGARERSDDFLVLINGWREPLTFVVPELGLPSTWRTELDTHELTPASAPLLLKAGGELEVGLHSIVVRASASCGTPTW